jgi:protein-S-isoprenylcysteine O-methyltransferase Ste14
MTKRIGFFVYGVASYLLFFATFLYAIGFVGDLVVPKTIDSGREHGLGLALLVDVALLTVFALQHSVMARPAFKRAWTRVVPESIERSTYVLASSLALILLFWGWQPLGGLVWQVEVPLARVFLHAAGATGWLLVLACTFAIDHFDLFGLRQVWIQLLDRPYTAIDFRTPGPYRFVRHPLYVGWLLAFWSTPTMSIAHLVFAVATTGYILAAIRLEERDLVAAHGEDYRRYRERVPMLLPLRRATRRSPASGAAHAG